MTEPKRVLQVFHSMNMGGAENMIMSLYRSIDKSKIQFDFLVHSSESGFFDDEIRSLGGRIFYAPYYRVFNEKEYKKSIEKLFDEHVELSVVHGHLGSCSHIYLKIAKSKGRYTIAHSHNTKTEKSFKYLLYWMFTRKTRKIADFFMACGVEAGISRFGQVIVDSDRFCVLKNAIYINKFKYNPNVRRDVRKHYGVTEKEIWITNIGRFNVQKNHHYMIELMRYISNMNESDRVKLFLVGDGSLKRKIEEQVAQYLLEDRIVFLGIRDDIPEILQATDKLIFPSLYEGLPVTVIEAQAAGCECILSENITKEVKITDLVRFLPITNESLGLWAKHVLSSSLTERKDMTKEITKAGYNVEQIAEWLELFYLAHASI